MTTLQAHLAIEDYRRIVNRFQSDPDSINGGEVAEELQEISDEWPELSVEILPMLSVLSRFSRRIDPSGSDDHDEWEGMTLNDLLGG